MWQAPQGIIVTKIINCGFACMSKGRQFTRRSIIQFYHHYMLVQCYNHHFSYTPWHLMHRIAERSEQYEIFARNHAQISPFEMSFFVENLSAKTERSLSDSLPWPPYVHTRWTRRRSQTFRWDWGCRMSITRAVNEFYLTSRPFSQ